LTRFFADFFIEWKKSGPPEWRSRAGPSGKTKTS
jgi:hypothetical protein